MYAPVYRLKALTLNNMGCTLMKENRPQEALDYLTQTLEIEIMGNYSRNQAAQTCLNLNFVLSKLGKHKEALEHAIKAIDMFKEEVRNQELAIP